MFSQRLRNRIVIQQKNGFLDSFGQMNETWTTFTSIWAEIIDLTGKEYFGAEAPQNLITTKMITRTRTPVAITPAMRVSYGGKLYNIEAVVSKNEHELHLLCSYGVKYV